MALRISSFGDVTIASSRELIEWPAWPEPLDTLSGTALRIVPLDGPFESALRFLLNILLVRRSGIGILIEFRFETMLGRRSI